MKIAYISAKQLISENSLIWSLFLCTFCVDQISLKVSSMMQIGALDAWWEKRQGVVGATVSCLLLTFCESKHPGN